jgi:hypothetical protein
LLWHRTKEPTPIRQIRPEVPDELAAVLARMLAKDPDQRYQTPADVAAALSQWVPADVPRPSEAEMPRLSPAATETDDYCTPATPLPVSAFTGSSSVVAVVPAPPRPAAAGPFAPAARPGPFAAEKRDNVLNTTLVHPVLSVDATPLCHTALPEPRPATWLERIGEQSQTIIIVAVAVAVSFAAGILFWKQLGH